MAAEDKPADVPPIAAVTEQSGPTEPRQVLAERLNAEVKMASNAKDKWIVDRLACREEARTLLHLPVGPLPDEQRQAAKEQYQRLIDSAEKHVDRRTGINNIFATVATLVVTGVAYAGQHVLSAKTMLSGFSWAGALLVVSGVGIAVAVSWSAYITTHGRGTKVKAVMLEALEDALDLPIKTYQVQAMLLGQQRLTVAEKALPSTIKWLCVLAGIGAVIRLSFGWF